MKSAKSPISGRQITRKEALKGLGDPKTWPKFAAGVYAEFRAKPQKWPKTSVLKQTVESLVKIRPSAVVPAPVFAKSLEKKRLAKGKKAKAKRQRRTN